MASNMFILQYMGIYNVLEYSETIASGLSYDMGSECSVPPTHPYGFSLISENLKRDE